MCKSWLPISCLLALSTQYSAAQTPSASYATLYSFTGQNGDGAYPAGSLTVGVNGHIYGTTPFGGSGACKVNNQTGCGIVFELSPSGAPGSAWTETVLYTFTAQNGDGAYPSGGLAIDSHGALYGLTGEGGEHNDGTVFVLKPPAAPDGQWTETILHSFNGGERDGSGPAGGVVFGENGILYGATGHGGKQHLGTVFALQPPAAGGDAWAEKVLFSFTGQGDAGVSPGAGVVIGMNGTLYGTAGGYAGVVFALRGGGAGQPWTESVLYAFGSQEGDGGTPFGGVVIGNHGKLYGTNNAGGPPTDICVPPVAGCGTVFEIMPGADGAGWTEKVIYAFTGLNGDGANPVAGVVIGAGGALFGTTTDGPGAVFQLTPPAAPSGVWTETVLHMFTGQNGDGAGSVANLTIGPNGTIYGTTAAGGTADMGTVFALKP